MEVQTLPDLAEEIARITDEVTRELRRLHAVEEESRLLRERRRRPSSRRTASRPKSIV